MKDKNVRIAKVISNYGFSSRKDAEELIKNGKVKINGKVSRNFVYKTKNLKEIKVNDKPLVKSEPKVWILHKPTGYICSNARQNNRKIIFDLLPKEIPRVVSIGRLDINSEGLLLMTNNPELSNYFENPKNNIPRKYLVKVFGEITSDLFGRTRRPIKINGVKYRPMNLKRISEKKNINTIEVILHEGKNREIRKIFKFFGLTVKKLVRKEYGPFKLGNIKLGEMVEIKQNVLQEKLNRLDLRIEDFSWKI